ncbi:MAG: signal peptidase I [Sandaracinaceae bacterium]
MTDDGAKERGAAPVSWKAIGLLAIPAMLVVAPTDALLMQAFGVEAYEADGPSMQPTLLHGDRFIVDRGAYGLRLPGVEGPLVSWSSPSPGEVLVIRSPMDGIDIVKRVVAVGGDEIEIRDDEVYVNGRSLTRQPYQTHGDDRTAVESVGARVWSVTVSSLTPPHRFGPVTVGAGHVFVLGDHRDRSNDSRNIGEIPFENIIGRAVGLYWSSADEVRTERIGLVLP